MDTKPRNAKIVKMKQNNIKISLNSTGNVTGKHIHIYHIYWCTVALGHNCTSCTQIHELPWGHWRTGTNREGTLSVFLTIYIYIYITLILLLWDLSTLYVMKIRKTKIYSSFIDNIWVADLADMQLLSKFNKEIRFLSCIFDFIVNMRGIFI